MRKSRIIYIIIFLIVLGGIFFYFKKEPSFGVISEFQEISWVRPTTDDQWKEDVKNEQLNYRFDFQLEEMRANLAEKIVKHKDDLDRLVECPDCYKYPLQKEGLKTAEIDQRYTEQVAQAREEYERVGRSLERIENEQRLRQQGKVERIQDILKIQPSTDREREELKKLK